MKVFYISFPFDEENCGDYDYCVTSAEALRRLGRFDVQYVRSTDVAGYDSKKANSLLSIIKGKNTGGREFYSSLGEFYSNSDRQALAESIKNYLLSNKIGQNVLNMQVRAPETGFLFSYGDLRELKTAGFKICVTCHEYKLNYDRRWLQTILHSYFSEADLVLFFSQKDLKNASKHANHSAFLDKTAIGDANSLLTHKLCSQPFTAALKPALGDTHYYNAVFKSTTLKQNLECELFSGNFITAIPKEPLVLHGDGEVSVVTVNRQTRLKFAGISKNVKILSQDVSLTGIALNIPFKVSQSTEVHDIATACGADLYKFSHLPYDLASKAKLTRVSPTVCEYACGSVSGTQKPCNIIIFGIIREGKGYEEAIEIAREIANNRDLPDLLKKMRILMVGNPLSYELLADILNEKFGLNTDKVHIDADLLKRIANEEPQDLGAFTAQMRHEKMHQLKHKISSQSMISDELIQHFYQNILEEQKAARTKAIITLSPIQKFVQHLESEMTEVLPIDIFLNVCREQLPAIFDQAKYAVKFDEKGWANNASALINMLAYGCILYTGWGMCTDSEVTSGRYKGAIVLPQGKYCLKSDMHLDLSEEIQDKRSHFTRDKKDLKHDAKKTLVIAKDILDDIFAREGGVTGKITTKAAVKAQTDEQSAAKAQILKRECVLISNYNNEATFIAAQALLQEFAAEKIAKEMTQAFLDLHKRTDISMIGTSALGVGVSYDMDSSNAVVTAHTTATQTHEHYFRNIGTPMSGDDFELYC